jgi:hypothetical protein
MTCGAWQVPRGWRNWRSAEDFLLRVASVMGIFGQVCFRITEFIVMHRYS